MQAQGTLSHAQDVSPSSWDAAKTCRSFPKGDLLKKLKVANESQSERTQNHATEGLHQAITQIDGRSTFVGSAHGWRR